jgi:heme-degrading monooxygenase HmoA
MFSVLFEVNPRGEEWDAYLDYAKMLRPELEQIDGFVDNIRYGSLTREGWILSLSGWQGEKSQVRWRTQARHHDVQSKGRSQVLADYHLRVGQITHDSQLPSGFELLEQRLDETQVGDGTTVTLLDTHREKDAVKKSTPQALAESLGLDPDADGLVSWDVFDAVLTPGDVILLLSWRDAAAAEKYRQSADLEDGLRLRQIRVVRDYGMYDRRENPQYYPDVERVK